MNVPRDFAARVAFVPLSSEEMYLWKELEKYGDRVPNVLGRLLVSLIGPAEEKAHELSVRIRTEINLTRAYVAVQCYRRDVGFLPGSLGDARSAGVAQSVYTDFFVEKPIQYSSVSGVLWSVGLDQKDDGSDTNKDIVVRLPNNVP